MRVKALLVMIAACCLLGGAGFAQEEKSADDIVSKMQTDLNLTADQAKAVKPIIEADMAKRQELRQSMEGAADRSAIRSQMEELNQDEEQKLSQVLNEDQMNQFKAAKSQRSQGMHHHHGMHSDGNDPSEK